VPQQEMRILPRRSPRALPDALAQGPSGLDQAAD